MAIFLVTGGCGFIGSHLAEALLARGDAVRVLDDLSTGKLANLPIGAALIRGDVADPETMRAAMDGVDGCFHLAAIASVERGVRDPLGTHRVNLTAAIGLMDAAARRRVPVVYASSAAVYGDAADLPLHEECRPRPVSAYGADKLGCEGHARAAGLAHGLRSTGLRFFNVFGPRQDPLSPYSGVISIFCDRLSRGEEVMMYGDGAQTRDFVHVGDVVAALLAAFDRASTDAPVLNVCSGTATSVAGLANTIARLCGTPLRLRSLPSRRGEVRHSVGSPVRARQFLDLHEAKPLRAGLMDTLAWMGTGEPEQSGRSAGLRSLSPYLTDPFVNTKMPIQSVTDNARIISAATGQASLERPDPGLVVPERQDELARAASVAAIPSLAAPLGSRR